jgi:predicted RNase H-like HicB family nuclease
MAKTLVYALTIEPHPEDGGFFAYFPSLTGCHTWGSSSEEAVKNAEEALQLYVETAAQHGEPLPPEMDTSSAVSLGIILRTPVAA